MPITRKHVKVPTMGAGWYPPDHPKHVRGLAFNGHADRNLRTSEHRQISEGWRMKHYENTEKMQPEGSGIKQGGDWFNDSEPSISRKTGSKPKAREAASAHIAKIPYELARHIARAWKPTKVA